MPGTSPGQQGPRGAVSGQRGYWLWNGTAWVWTTADEAGPSPGQGSPAYNQPNVGAGAGGPVDEGRQVNSAFGGAGAEGPNPFGNELQGIPMTYTPFGLQDRYGSAFGAPSMRYPLSYNSDNLAPNLEGRRMQMLQSLFTGGR